ncbi:MAG TPA: hypothetical protein VKP30_26535 [Polyangiaceae bacterium]|nr:hypothetical protein [Polyangiaceae bacterium]
MLFLLCGCQFESGGLGSQAVPSDKLSSSGGAPRSSGSSAALEPKGGGAGALGASAAEETSGGHAGGSVSSAGESVTNSEGGGGAENVASQTASQPSGEVSRGGGSSNPHGSASTASPTSSGGTINSGIDSNVPSTATSGGVSESPGSHWGGTAQASAGSGGVSDASTSTNGGAPCSPGAFGPPEPITGLLPEGFSYSSPSLSADGLSLYFSAAKPGEGEEDIYVATRSSRTNGFYPATALTEINSTAADGTPSISSDGMTLFFSSTRPGSSGGRDLYSARRANKNGLFGDVRPVTVLNSTADDTFPSITADGLTLVFSSTRSGVTDLFIAQRQDVAGKFAAPVALDRVNTTDYREERATLSRDELTIYFVSDRSNGLGDRDIWYATRSSVESAFANVRNLTSVNSQYRDVDVALSADDQEMYFVSKRQGKLEIYRSVRACP